MRWRRAGWVAALVIGATVSGAAAEGIRQWRTPDGSLYFGDAPPAGSTYVTDVPKLETVGDGYVPTTPPAPVEPSRTQQPSPSEAHAIDREVQGTWKKMNDALAGHPRPK